MVSISVIVGSTRDNRFADKPANWILRHLQERPDIDAKLLDLRDFPMPYFNELVAPAYIGHAPYANEVVGRWTAEIAASDGFVIVTPEYNHGYPAELKNAIDYVFPEWNRKPVTFVSYGNAGGARAIEQLRQVVVELEMAPIRKALSLPISLIRAHYMEGDVPAEFAAIDELAGPAIDELLWWTKALKTARAAV